MKEPRFVWRADNDAGDDIKVQQMVDRLGLPKAIQAIWEESGPCVFDTTLRTQTMLFSFEGRTYRVEVAIAP